MSDSATEVQARVLHLLEQEEQRAMARGPKQLDGVALVVKPKTWKRRADDRYTECVLLSVRAPHLMPVETLHNVLASARESMIADPEMPRPRLVAKVRAYGVLVLLLVRSLVPRTPADLATLTYLGCLRVMALHPAIAPLARLKLHFQRYQTAAVRDAPPQPPFDVPTLPPEAKP